MHLESKTAGIRPGRFVLIFAAPPGHLTRLPRRLRTLLLCYLVTASLIRVQSPSSFSS